MLEFDEYGRYVIMNSLITDEAARMLFKSKDEYYEYCRQVYKQNFWLWKKENLFIKAQENKEL